MREKILDVLEKNGRIDLKEWLLCLAILKQRLPMK